MESLFPQLDESSATAPIFPKHHFPLSRFGKFLLKVGLPLVAPAMVSLPATSAETIYLDYGPLQFSISVESLERLATEGEIEGDLKTFARFVEPEQLAQLQQALVTPANLSPSAVAQFLYSPEGEAILRQVGQLIETKARQHGFYAIRAALIQAAADEDGLTPLNVIKKFPTNGIRINSSQGFELIEQLSNTIEQTTNIAQLIEQQSLAQMDQNVPLNFSALPNLATLGTVPFSVRNVVVNDLIRNREIAVDLYLPQQQREGKLPLVIISHGLGSDRQTFAYLAKHLASHGWAVAVPEHPGSSATQIGALLRGLATQITPARELIDRPLDIKLVLDQLESSFEEQINLKDVGIIGQSFGAYTVLALAGADLNFERLQEQCPAVEDVLNLSLLLQCKALQLPNIDYELRDRRIGAAIAINPFTSLIFGEDELNKIDIPLMIVSASADTVTPALSEQIRPFSELENPEKYLVLLEGGTHFSTLDESTGSIPIPAQVIGPNPTIARNYLQALSLAFYRRYITEQREYTLFLSPNYARFLSQPEIPLFLVESLNEEQLTIQVSNE